MQVGLKTIRLNDEVEVTYDGHAKVRVGVVSKFMGNDGILVKQSNWLKTDKWDTRYRHFKVGKIVHIKVR